MMHKAINDQSSFYCMIGFIKIDKDFDMDGLEGCECCGVWDIVDGNTYLLGFYTDIFSEYGRNVQHVRVAQW